MPQVSLTITLLLSFLILTVGLAIPFPSTAFPREEDEHWILAGLSLIRRLDCTYVTSIGQQECAKIRISRASRFVAYVATLEQEGSGGLIVTHPEEQEESAENVVMRAQAENFTGVLVLDPFADRAFGHPLFIFRIVTFSGSREEQLQKCLTNRGLMYKSQCIYQEVKSGCPRVFFSAGQHKDEFKPSQGDANCEYQFLPRVTTSDSAKDLLQCVPHAAQCLSEPQQRQRRKRLHRRRVPLPAYLHENLSWNRDPQWINPLTLREVSNSLPPQRPIRPSTSSVINHQYSLKFDDDTVCSSYDRCDHALLLASEIGDRNHADPSISGRPHKRYLIDKMRSLGFAMSYLSVFPPEERPQTSHHFFQFPVKQKDTPKNTSVKTNFRTRMQKLCRTPRCVSTLFLYLNNFVLPNGDMLIGGPNSTSLNERYSVSEFLSDLSECQSSLVFALVDQNFGGFLLEALNSRQAEFTNLVLLSATRQASVFQTEQVAEKKQFPEFFFPRHYTLQLDHYDLYGVEDLLTYAIEHLPLSQMLIGDVEKQIRTLYPYMELGTFYGSRVQAHASNLFAKPVIANQFEGGFIRGHLSSPPQSAKPMPQGYIAGCVSLSPIEWLRNYLPSVEQ